MLDEIITEKLRSSIHRVWCFKKDSGTSEAISDYELLHQHFQSARASSQHKNWPCNQGPQSFNIVKTPSTKYLNHSSVLWLIGRSSCCLPTLLNRTCPSKRLHKKTNIHLFHYAGSLEIHQTRHVVRQGARIIKMKVDC